VSTLKTDTPNTRSIALEVEVPGSPEQVWQAIATGPGITAWFTASEVEERAGGAIRFDLGPGMDSSGVVTVWEPHRRLGYEERDWAPGAPPLATEFTIETRGGGTCVVRLVNSLFTSRADWDDQLESFEAGWRPYLRILALYLEHFPGQRCVPIRVMGAGAGTQDQTWSELSSRLGVAGAAVGERRAAPAGLPALAGTVERLTDHEIVLRTDQPAPGFALAGAFGWGGGVHTMLSLYLFGPQSPSAVARDAHRWRAWMDGHFPSARVPSAAAHATTA
jgi:uncharacterized protein YndB with AHSA1/START domain